MRNTREIGTQYEDAAGIYLKNRGFSVKECNFRCKQGEIDIIGYDKEYLVFVEVKYRSSKNQGTPEDAVTLTKQKRICRTADYYRLCHGYSDDKPIRYDVVAVIGRENAEEFKWYKNAFPHIYRC